MLHQIPIAKGEDAGPPPSGNVTLVNDQVFVGSVTANWLRITLDFTPTVGNRLVVATHVTGVLVGPPPMLHEARDEQSNTYVTHQNVRSVTNYPQASIMSAVVAAAPAWIELNRGVASTINSSSNGIWIGEISPSVVGESDGHVHDPSNIVTFQHSPGGIALAAGSLSVASNTTWERRTTSLDDPAWTQRRVGAGGSIYSREDAASVASEHGDATANAAARWAGVICSFSPTS